MTRRKFLELAAATGATLLGLGCATKQKPTQYTPHTPQTTTTTTPSQPTSIDTKITQALDTTQGNIVSTLEIYTPEKPTIQVEYPYTQTLEPKPRGNKWTLTLEQQKPVDYQITILAGDQQEKLSLDGPLSPQEYQSMTRIQDTLDQMYHQAIKDQRLGQGIQQKKKTMKKAAQYATHETPQNPEAIQATLALAHATTNKKLPENPDDIYNLVKKINQNPQLWNGAETHEYHDDYGNTFLIHTENQAEHAWLLSRVLKETEKRHGPTVSREYGLWIGHNTSWWSHIQQLIQERGGGYVRIGDIDYNDGKQHKDITHPDYLDLALTSTDWHITLSKKRESYFPVDDHSLQQKFSDPKDRALALQFLAETPFKTWTTDYTGIEYGFQAAKTFWNHHVPKAKQLVEEVLKDWPIGPNGRHMASSYYIILIDALNHGELYTMTNFMGLENVNTPKDLDTHPAIKLINSHIRSPDMDDVYMREYPDAPTNVLSKNSEEWRGVKFIYSATHVSPMYADKVGWPKRRPNEREYYEEMLPAMAAANGLPWTYEAAGVFRAEYATTIDDRIASLLKQKYGSDLAIGPANLVGPFISKQAARKDGSKRITFMIPRHTKKETGNGQFFIWRA